LRRLALVAVLAALLGPAPTAAAADDPGVLLNALDSAWRSRDVAAYLALWEFDSEARREQETDFAREAFRSPEIQVGLQSPGLPPNADRARFNAQMVFVDGLTAHVEMFSMGMRRGSHGWALTERAESGRIDGLVHLALDPSGFRADGLRLRLEDFDLDMNRGTLFTSMRELGPTAMVFVGEGVVHVRPRPETEREQLRQFCGNQEMVQEVKAAYIRINPLDIATELVPARLEVDPDAPSRLGAAERFFREHAPSSFVLDGLLPGSPWWVVPAQGDALVNFDAGKRGGLTFAISGSRPESINLFDRAKRMQICLYPKAGGSLRYNEDDGRDADTIHHDLRVRFDPREGVLRGADTLQLRLLTDSSTLRLRLDDALAVESVSSKEAGSHLFFRVRGQDSLMISLGPLAGAGRVVSLTLRFGGAFSPAPVESEVIQAPPFNVGTLSSTPPGLNVAFDVEKVQVFSSRNAWYPQAGNDDYATARLRLSVPTGFLALSSGQQVAAQTEGDDLVSEFRMEQPGKYLSVVVGRLSAVASRREGDLSLEGFAVSRAKQRVAQDLDRAVEILRFFTEEFGPCPYNPVRLVDIEGATPGGHSPPGMVILAARPPFVTTRLADDPASFEDVPGFFLAHELAHQWWGQGVAPQNYRERWLAEGMAQYAAALWVRRDRGEGEFQDVLKRMGRWAVAESHVAPINLGFRVGHVRGDPQAYRGVIYDKGAYVLHMLRRIVGDEAFRKALTAIQEQRRYGKAGTDDLREALEGASGRDLKAYFDQWVYATTLPRLRFSHKTTSTGAGQITEIDVRPENLPGPVPLELAVVHRSGRQAILVDLPPEGGRWTIATPDSVRHVEVNADRGLLLER
jgi:Peptidase family M1 domain